MFCKFWTRNYQGHEYGFINTYLTFISLTFDASKRHDH